MYFLFKIIKKKTQIRWPNDTYSVAEFEPPKKCFLFNIFWLPSGQTSVAEFVPYLTVTTCSMADLVPIGGRVS